MTTFHSSHRRPALRTGARILSVTLAAAYALTACSGTQPQPSSSPAASSPVTPDFLAPVETTSAPVAIAADAPVGTQVPLDQVDALRAAGTKVYVGTNDIGTVVALGQPLPDAVVADIKAAALVLVDLTA
jgi:hypothetical protein